MERAQEQFTERQIHIALKVLTDKGWLPGYRGESAGSTEQSV